MSRRVIPALLLSSLASCVPSLYAATFVVSTTADSGAGSLRAAIQAANISLNPPHRIEFAPSYPLNGTLTLKTALPLLTVSVEIDGNGRAPLIENIDPTSNLRPFSTTRALTLRRLELVGGRAELSGGCIRLESGSGSRDLLLDRVMLRQCLATASGVDTANGGAVYWPGNGSVTVLDSGLYGNGAAHIGNGNARGGAIYSEGALRIERSDFEDQIVNGGFVSGGAVHLAQANSAPIEIRDSQFRSNRATPAAAAPNPAGLGGALSLDCTTCAPVIERSSFVANYARNGAGAFIRGNNGVGAASLRLDNTHFLSNIADDSGGGLFLNGVALDARHLSFHANYGTAGGHVNGVAVVINRFANSLLAPVDAGSASGCAIGAVATVSVGNFRASSDNSCGIGLAPGATAVADFQLDGRDSSRLPTILRVLAGSPVVDAADPGQCLPVDARGTPRPQDGNDDGNASCDAGAWERPAERLFRNGFES